MHFSTIMEPMVFLGGGVSLMTSIQEGYLFEIAVITIFNMTKEG